MPSYSLASSCWVMMMTQKDNAGKAGALTDCRPWLEGDDLLSPELRESYRRTPGGFEGFCRKRVAARAPAVWPQRRSTPT